MVVLDFSLIEFVSFTVLLFLVVLYHNLFSTTLCLVTVYRPSSYDGEKDCKLTDLLLRDLRF